MVEVRARVGDGIDLLEFVMADGAVGNGGHPSTGGTAAPALSLGPDEHIVQMEVSQGATLDRVTVVTSKGRKADWQGRLASGGASPATYVTSAENPIVGFERGGGGPCPRVNRVLRLSDSAAAARPAGSSAAATAGR